MCCVCILLLTVMGFHLHSLLQMPSAGAHRLSSVSSHDSGFVSQDANTLSKPPSPMPSDITSQVAFSVMTLRFHFISFIWIVCSCGQSISDSSWSLPHTLKLGFIIASLQCINTSQSLISFYLLTVLNYKEAQFLIKCES